MRLLTCYQAGDHLFGAPALSMKDFTAYRQYVIIGASLTVIAPGGQYDPDKLFNVGSSRWSFKPEIANSKGMGPLFLRITNSY